MMNYGSPMRILTIIISILIITAVLIPGANIPSVNVVGVDKFVHVAMFATWAIVILFDFRSLTPWMVFVAGLFFSVATEVLQLFVEGRSFDLYDMVADAAGLLLGLLLAKPCIKILGKLFTRDA